MFLGIALGVIILAGVVLNPFGDQFQLPLFKSSDKDIGYTLGGTPVVVENKLAGNWPSNVADSTALDTLRNRWLRYDNPVKNNRATRNWLVGSTTGPQFLEPYQDNFRLVQYGDKVRLQVDDPLKSSTGISFGALARELLTGKVEVDSKQTMQLGVPGGPVLGAAQPDNPAPGFAALARVSSLKQGQNKTEREINLAVTATLNSAGEVGSGTDEGLNRYKVTNASFSDENGHNIPNVFLDYFNQRGLVYQNGDYVAEKIFDWQELYGQPLSEAYWIKALLDGSLQDVLLQVYENNILVYYPNRQAELRVEGLNLGKLYYEWRYKGLTFSQEAPAPAANTTPTPVPSGGLTILNARFSFGNEKVARNLVVQNGRIVRNMLVNRTSGQVYADLKSGNNLSGFSFRLVGPNNNAYLVGGDQFNLIGYSFTTWNDNQKYLELKGQLTFQGQPLNLHLYYRADSGGDFLEKWIGLEPNENLRAWNIRLVSIEDTQVIKQLRPAARTPEQDSLPLLTQVERTSSVPDGAIFTDLMVHQNANEGLYFFSATPLGGEWATDSRLVLMQEDLQSLAEGFTSGKAVLGTFTGKVDLGFKRLTDYLENQYSQMAGKRQPVWFSTWYPFTTDINQDLLLGELDKMKELGIYDVLHIDAGWESDWPLQVNKTKFPGDLKLVSDKATSMGLSLGLWINPFSFSYGRYTSYSAMHKAHPEWHVRGLEKDMSGLDYRVGPFGINTDYYFYVKEQLEKLISNYNIRELYWDGADWNIPEASAPGLNEEQQRLARVIGTKRLVALVEDLRKIRPDLIIVGWNSTANVHLLGALDQLQLSDNWSLPLGVSELARQQQFYAATYHLPYYSIWGDWYSLTYKENGDKNLDQPLETLTYAETSMIGTGAFYAGASLDLANVAKTKPALLDHIKKLFSWRKKFEGYFQTYQHILDYPSDNQVYGEGHIINGKGFLLLNNPTSGTVKVPVPLTASELELQAGMRYQLFDWSSLTLATPIGQFVPGDGQTVSIPPHSVKIIGVEIGSFPPAQ